MRLVQLCRRHEVEGETAAGAETGAAADAGSSSCLQGGTGRLNFGDNAEEAADCRGGGDDDSEAAQLQGLGLPAGSSGQRLLSAFLRRMQTATLGGAALEQERLRLMAENAALRAVVAGVQEGRGVSTAAVQGPLSTLFIVNSRLQRELEGAAAQRKALASRVAQGKGQQQHQLLQLR